jgi:hypothetical protein
VGAEEAAFFVHELLVRTPAAGAALVWLDARHQLLDLFAVVCGDHEVEEVAATVLRAPWSPVSGLVVGSRLPHDRSADPPGPAEVDRWRALRARFDGSPVDLVDWLLVGEEVIWSLDEVDLAS